MQEIMPTRDGGESYTTRRIDGGPPVSSLHIGEYGIRSVERETSNGEFSFRETGR
jgi:hypothetical protein